MTVISTLRQRRETASQHYRTLAEVVTDERLPAEYRRKVASESKRSIAFLNGQAQAELRRELAAETAPHRARMAEGLDLSGEEVLKAQALAAQYAGTPKRITETLTEALAKGATGRARVAYQAALIAGQPVDRFYGDVAASDPALTSAMARVAALELIASTLVADVHAERAAALPRDSEEWASASIHAKAGRERLGIHPSDTSTPALEIVVEAVAPVLR